MAMHLATMMHGTPIEREPVQHPSHTQHYLQPSSQCSARQTRQDYHYRSQQQPQSPPSPPAEEQKPSLPSISNLLAFAANDNAPADTSTALFPAPLSVSALTTSSAAHSIHSQRRQSTPPQNRQPQPHHHRPAFMPQPLQPHASRPDQLAPPAASSLRMAFPPTPPMHSDVTLDGNRSPSAASNYSTTSTPYFVPGTLNDVDPDQQRQSVTSLSSLKRETHIPPVLSPYSASTYSHSPYASSPAATPATSFYSPERQPYNSSAMYVQRPLPTNFPPTTVPLPVSVSSPVANGSNPWQHHHYISSSSQSQFQQSQDRYICSTCNKAFSRPSSLRIHSHSHTGEKPYKCPQLGCGKAFSVRSNMKRHERGCRAAAGAPLTT